MKAKKELFILALAIVGAGIGISVLLIYLIDYFNGF